MSYPESVRYLYSLGNELKVGAKFGLERMRILLEALSHPETNQQFVHVAGTNGKGSTCAMIASGLKAAGHRTGLFTSPHLIEPTERIQIGGEQVTEHQFSEAFETVHRCAEQLVRQNRMDSHPTYFETVTAMALVIFRQCCDTAVMEVGLGGRLDATNVIEPRLTVITPVSFDHEAYLGNTLEAIAGEKAGILKREVPVIMAKQAKAAEQVITRHAHDLSCPIIRAGKAQPGNVELHAYGSAFELNGTRFSCPLPGEHQVQNATVAVLAMRQLGLPEEAIQHGLSETIWPGRLERVRVKPDFILDGAHNPAGASALAAYIRQFYSERPLWLVYGAMRDKAIEEVTSQLFPLARKIILTAPDFPRALRPEAILQIARHPNTVTAPDLSHAIELAAEAPPDAAVFFTGSLFLVGEARALLSRETQFVS
ncbi:MAG: bifunctional folylpolyglutamate synthase/dihydrofolate synthase [Acidobacteriaceae bacterium]|nr:bifunctional folylpolyglutamate synthase/dihydrofolate synthase [Acidobacteriaceae bacterium]